MVEISNKYVLRWFFFTKVAIISEDLIVIGSLYQVVGPATEEARLPILSLVFRK